MTSIIHKQHSVVTKRKLARAVMKRANYIAKNAYNTHNTSTKRIEQFGTATSMTEFLSEAMKIAWAEVKTGKTIYFDYSFIFTNHFQERWDLRCAHFNLENEIKSVSLMNIENIPKNILGDTFKQNKEETFIFRSKNNLYFICVKNNEGAFVVVTVLNQNNIRKKIIFKDFKNAYTDFFKYCLKREEFLNFSLKDNTDPLFFSESNQFFQEIILFLNKQKEYIKKLKYSSVERNFYFLLKILQDDSDIVKFQNLTNNLPKNRIVFFKIYKTIFNFYIKQFKKLIKKNDIDFVFQDVNLCDFLFNHKINALPYNLNNKIIKQAESFFVNNSITFLFENNKNALRLIDNLIKEKVFTSYPVDLQDKIINDIEDFFINNDIKDFLYTNTYNFTQTELFQSFSKTFQVKFINDILSVENNYLTEINNKSTTLTKSNIKKRIGFLMNCESLLINDKINKEVNRIKSIYSHFFDIMIEYNLSKINLSKV